jgi:hypothetical protein
MATGATPHRAMVGLRGLQPASSTEHFENALPDRSGTSLSEVVGDHITGPRCDRQMVSATTVVDHPRPARVGKTIHRGVRGRGRPAPSSGTSGKGRATIKPFAEAREHAKTSEPLLFSTSTGFNLMRSRTGFPAHARGICTVTSWRKPQNPSFELNAVAARRC